MTPPRWLAVGLALLGLTLPVAAGAQQAALRLAHLVPDAPRVDLVVDGVLFLRDVPFAQVTQYVLLPAGEREISVYPHRLPEDPTGEGRPRPLEPVTIVVQIEEAGYYTVALSGFYQPRPEEGQTGALSLTVEPAGARVDLAGPRGFSRTFTGNQLFEGLEPGSYTVRAELEGYQTLTYEVRVQPLETAIAALTLQSGEQGPQGAPQELPAAAEGGEWRPVELHMYQDEFSTPPPGQSLIRFAHLSPILLPVDASVLPAAGGEAVPVAAGLGFPNGTGYVAVPASEMTLRLSLAGSGVELADFPGLTLEPGTSYSLFLVREPGDNFVRIVPVVDATVTVKR